MEEFRDRVEAGRHLAQRLLPLRDENAVVLGLPRGGVPVAYEVAVALELDLDVIVVRKLGVPVQPELAMGAIGEEGARVIDKRIMNHFRITQEQLTMLEDQERAELVSRTTRFREGRERIDLKGRTALIVDDGIATGATARVACRVAAQLGAARVVLAVPVAAEQAMAQISEADEVVVLSVPPDFTAVGLHYRDFAATQDEEVVALLGAARHRHASQPTAVDAAAPAEFDGDVHIPAGDAVLEGHLHAPSVNTGVVIFAHGSGSGRHSPRNQYVASVLQDAGLGTLLLDLLTPSEEADRANVFDIGLLAQRLAVAATWVHQHPPSASSPIGYFGASTGAGAALWAAAEPGARIEAVVSRGGRPDLADPRLGDVEAPTLLIVGGKDTEVLGLNRQAQAQLRCENRLAVVEGATHLFEEPGTLRSAAELARDWFIQYLPRA